ATDGKIVVVEHQRSRYAVLVKLEFDGVNRRLLTTPGAAVKITHGDRPSLEPGERLFATGRIGGSPLVGRDYPTNDCERVENLVALVRSIIEGHLQNALVLTRGRDDAAHMVGRKCDGRLQIQFFIGRLGQGDRNALRSAVGLA